MNQENLCPARVLDLLSIFYQTQWTQFPWYPGNPYVSLYFSTAGLEEIEQFHSLLPLWECFHVDRREQRDEWRRKCPMRYLRQQWGRWGGVSESRRRPDTDPAEMMCVEPPALCLLPPRATWPLETESWCPWPALCSWDHQSSCLLWTQKFSQGSNTSSLTA